MTDPQVIVNLGTGGSDLNGQNGSTSSADSNDARFLDWPGDNTGNYVYLPGVISNSLSVPDEAALDITGDIDVRVRVAMDDWTPSATQVLIGKWFTTGNQRSYFLAITSTGAVQFAWSNDGAATVSRVSTSTLSLADNSVTWIRATLDVDNGASGHDVAFFTSDDGSTWTPLGSTITTAGTASIFSGSSDLHIGQFPTNLFASVGKFYRAQVLDGIDGTTVLDVDTSVITSGSATSFTDLTGNHTVSINRSSSGRKSVAVVSPVWLLGTDDYMEVAANALLGADPSQDFSVMLIHRVWDTPASDAAKINTALPANGSGDVRRGWAVRQLTTTYQHQSYWQDDTLSPVDSLESGLAVSSGSLSTVGFVADRTAQKITSFTENGFDSAGADITSVTSTVTPNVLRIGRYTRTGTTYSDMEVVAAVVVRRALSFAEVSQVYSYYQNRAG